MSAFSAHRQGCAYYMADRFFQRVGSRTVLYRQVYTDLGDVHIRHGTTHRKLFCIRQGRGGCPSLGNGCAGQHSIVLRCGFALGGQLGIVGVFDSGYVAGFYVRMILFTQKFSHQWVKQKAQRHNAASCRQ